MICQVCGATNELDREYCIKCQSKLLVVSGASGAYEEGTLFVLTLHPYMSGHRAPMKHLNELVGYMKSKKGVWFATGAEVARYVKGEQR